MKKRLIALFMVLVFCMASVGAVAETEAVWEQFQIEAADAVAQLVALYQEQHPDVKITADVNGTNLSEVLKAMFSSGDIPEIFMTEGYNNMLTYEDYLLDLSDQPFVEKLVEAAKPCITTEDGTVVGLPVTFQSEGICYNKAIFEQYGIEVPTTYSELVAVCEKLQENGVTPFVNEFKDDWLLGQYLAIAGYAMIPDTTEFTQKLYKGEEKFAGNEKMLRSFDLLDLMVKYGLDDPLSYGWNEACTAFALGEAAMIFEGEWIWGTLEGIDPTMSVGMFAVPVSETAAENKIATDVNGVWHVGKGSEAQDVAVDILNWMATDEGAKDILLNVYHVTPVFQGWEYVSSNPLADDGYVEMTKNNVNPWPWPTWPESFRGEAGKLYQEYLLGNMTREQVLEGMDTLWAKLALN